MGSFLDWLPYVLVACVLCLVAVMRMRYRAPGTDPMDIAGAGGYMCPDCGAATLDAEARLEVSQPVQEDSTLLALKCSSCGFTAAAQRVQPGSEAGHVSTKPAGFALANDLYARWRSALEAGNAERAAEIFEPASAGQPPFSLELPGEDPVSGSAQ